MKVGTRSIQYSCGHLRNRAVSRLIKGDHVTVLADACPACRKPVTGRPPKLDMWGDDDRGLRPR